MKETYITPLAEAVQMDCGPAPLCISGEEFVEFPGMFDMDSD